MRPRLEDSPSSPDNYVRDDSSMYHRPLRDAQQTEMYVDDGSLIRRLGRRILLSMVIVALVSAWPFVAIGRLFRK